MSETLKYNHENNGEKDYPYTQLHEVGEFFREQCKDPLDAIERTSVVIGVIADTKPAGLVGFEYRPGSEEQQEAFEANLQNMGINFIVQDTGGVYQHYFISKDLETARALQQAFLALWANNGTGNSSDDIDERLGHLLGYPETAIQYVKSGKASAVDPLQKRPDTLMVHDPAHFEEEYATYEQPIYDIMNKACPDLTEALQHNQKQKLGQRILSFFKKARDWRLCRYLIYNNDTSAKRQLARKF